MGQEGDDAARHPIDVTLPGYEFGRYVFTTIFDNQRNLIAWEDVWDDFADGVDYHERYRAEFDAPRAPVARGERIQVRPRHLAGSHDPLPVLGGVRLVASSASRRTGHSPLREPKP